MIKTKNWRRRTEGDDAEIDETEKSGVRTLSDKSAKSGRKESGKDKATAKATTHKLLSFAGDEEDADGSSGRRVLGTRKSGSKKEKAAKAGGNSLLSFDEEQDADVVVAPKSKKKSGFGTGHGSGHKMGKEKLLGPNSTPSNVQPQAGEYTKEKLLELERNTLRLGGPKATADGTPSEPVLVLKGLVKPATAVNGAAVEASGEEENLFNWCAHDDRGASRDEIAADSRLALMSMGPGADGGGITQIPDAAAIAAAKAKRERMRLAQAAPDYISLGSTETVHSRGKLRESGLVREQDDDLDKDVALSSDDEGEVRGRMAFLGDKPSGQKKKGGVFDSVDDRADGLATQHRDEDEEDEERRWEEEQFRKGVGNRFDDSSVRVTNAAVGSAPATHSTVFVSGSTPALSHSGAGWGFGGRPMEALSASQQAELAIQAMRDELQRLRV